ncbi:hypothetical protein H9Q74_004429 [Fusarium xylarioides]|nr:hypothetical protein H9Q71_010669 [Fusarium xylarioides]KAG5825459.1 hypothetical protein H9Q74_004429 [Fusarium xylarioides]
MEPVGALASVITIVGLIRPTAKFVKALRGIASENGTVASEIHRMATRIQTSATSIDIALEDLKSHSSTLRRISSTPSKILQHMIDNKSMQTIVSGTQSIRNQMRDKAQELKQMKKQPNLYKKLKWCIWDKMEVESLFPEMQLVAVCLSLVCPIIRLEVNQFMLEKSPSEVAQCLRQEMAYLRGQLKMVEKQCQTLIQEQHSNISSEFEAEFYSTAKPLLRLAKSKRFLRDYIEKYRLFLKAKAQERYQEEQEERRRCSQPETGISTQLLHYGLHGHPQVYRPLEASKPFSAARSAIRGIKA